MTTIGLSLRDRNLRFALLKAISDAIAEQLADERYEHTCDLIARYDDDGVKSFDVKLPDGTKVATISLTIPKDKVEVVDESALIEWAKENDRALVEEVTHAPVPAYTETRLVGKQVADLLARVKHDVTGDAVYDPDTGVLVDGIKVRAGGMPRSFSVRYEGDGREALALAYRAGSLAHLVGGTVLPAVEGPAVEAGASDD